MRTILALAILPLLVLAHPASASLALDASVEELARRADSVVEGVVAHTRTTVADEGRRIFTVVTVEVAATHKGTPASTVEVVLPGGAAGDLAQQVSGLPSFEAGESVFLFLTKRPGRRPTFALSALGLSAFRLQAGRAERLTEGLEVVTGPLDRTPKPPPDRVLPLDELRRRVRSALAPEAR